MKLLVQISTTVTSVRAATMSVALQVAPDNGSGLEGTLRSLGGPLPIYALATLVAGARLYDMDMPRPPAVFCPSFIRLSTSSAGATTTAVPSPLPFPRSHDVMYNSTTNAILAVPRWDQHRELRDPTMKNILHRWGPSSPSSSSCAASCCNRSSPAQYNSRKTCVGLLSQTQAGNYYFQNNRHLLSQLNSAALPTVSGCCLRCHRQLHRLQRSSNCLYRSCGYSPSVNPTSLHHVVLHPTSNATNIAVTVSATQPFSPSRQILTALARGTGSAQASAKELSNDQTPNTSGGAFHSPRHCEPSC